MTTKTGRGQHGFFKVNAITNLILCKARFFEGFHRQIRAKTTLIKCHNR
ncbi:Uncharacterised protein [Vibrio cholerae]|nr:Uncharacterised protein [Vibrio cholerae]